MAKPDIDGLRQFVEEKDRAPPACFAGRKKLIEDVHKAAGAMMYGATHGRNVRGLTMLVQGAPGAGKTALLEELDRRWRQEASGRQKVEGVPVPVMMDRDGLYDEEKTVLAIVAAMANTPGGTPGWNVETVDFRKTASHGVSGGVKVMGLTVGGRLGSAEAPETPSFDVLRSLQAPATWTRPAVLMVDEIQKTERAAKEVLNKLHNSMKGLPVLTVLAGLGDSYDHLGQDSGVGLTRFGMGTIHDIGLLAPEEAAASVMGFFETFHVGLEGADPRAWAECLAQESDGWPQHLHNGQRALAEALIETGGRLADVDAERTLDRAAAFREAAYRRQISQEMKDTRCLTAAVMESLPPEGLRPGQVLGAIQRARDPEGEDPEWSLPEGMTATAFRTHLVHQGALQLEPARTRSGEVAIDRYRCPIPSFRSYIVELGQEEPPPPDERHEKDDGTPEP